MKKESTPEPHTSDDLRSEYSFDYRKERPNRFATSPLPEGSVVVVLDADVAQVFTTPEAVNDMLRALIKNMPARVKNAA